MIHLAAALFFLLALAGVLAVLHRTAADNLAEILAALEGRHAPARSPLRAARASIPRSAPSRQRPHAA